MTLLAETFTVKARNLQPGMRVDFDGDLAYSPLGGSEYVSIATVSLLPVPAFATGYVRTLAYTRDGRYVHIESWADADLRIIG